MSRIPTVGGIIATVILLVLAFFGLYVAVDRVINSVYNYGRVVTTVFTVAIYGSLLRVIKLSWRQNPVYSER